MISSGQRCRALGVWGALMATGCGDAAVPVPVPAATPEAGEELSGGETTVFDTTRDAFARPARNLSDAHRDLFSLGDHFFNRNWITAPASASGNDGLGPLYNATSCSACHFHDGRGAPPDEPGEPFLGLLLRLSVPGEDPHGGPLGDPAYGGQLNHRAILDVDPEAETSVSYVEVAGEYADGTPFSLRRPTYAFAKLAYGPLAVDLMVSPRTAPHMVGLGLLEAVPEETLSALADEDDADGDGISGRPNTVWDVKHDTTAVGRFGWKANQPTIEQQALGAFLGDIGITSPVFPDENCTPAEEACSEATNGGTPELTTQKVEAVVSYAMTLAVPARRGVADPEVLRGKGLFTSAGCAGCHVPKLLTGTIEEYPELSEQTIRPYTDLLLHDLGPDLADERPDFQANGREWRTPPLWGIGLVSVVSRHSDLLHDGRARGFAEAILWHGGEAEASRELFRHLGEPDREALLAFLGSL